MKDLTIRLRLDRSQAKAAAEGQIADHRRMGDSAVEAANRERKSNQQVLTDAQVAARAKQQLIQQTNRERIKAAVDAEHVERKSNETTLGGLVAIGSQTLAAVGAAHQLLNVMQQVARVTDEAARRQRELQRNFVEERENTAELAAIMGQPADNKFVAANAQFNVDTGMKPREGLAFRSNYQNSAAQFNGKTIDPGEYDQYEKQSAQLAVARGMNPAESGDFFGKILGLKDFRKFGDQASEQALATGNASIEILKRGSGDNAVLIRQLNMLNSSLLSEDEMKGTITDPNVSATLISTAAEKHDASAAEMVKAAVRGLRDFNNKDAQPLLQAAQVNPGMDPIQAIRAIAPAVEKEARESGLKIDDVLKKYFHDHLTSEGIGVLINRGVNAGIFDDRAALAAGTIPNMPPISGPGPALDTIAQHQAGERGMIRKVDAETEQQKLAKGGGASDVELLRRQAEKRLTDRGELGTTKSEMEDWWFSVTRLGLIDPKEFRADNEMVKMLQERGKAKGVPVSDMLLWQDDSVEGKNRALQGAMGQIRDAGGQPLIDAMNDIKQAVKDQTNLIQKQDQPTVRPPMGGPRPTVTR